MGGAFQADEQKGQEEEGGWSSDQGAGAGEVKKGQEGAGEGTRPGGPQREHGM